MADDSTAFYPGRAPLDAYGNGGFRFAEMSHQGSLLLLPSGIYSWPVQNYAEITESSFDAVFAESKDIEFLLFGTGPALIVPSETIRTRFRSSGVGLEFMDTGAAARTYNVVLAEHRAVAAALIAVE